MVADIPAAKVEERSVIGRTQSNLARKPLDSNPRMPHTLTMHLHSHPQRLAATQALIADFPEANPDKIAFAIAAHRDDAPVRASLVRRYGNAKRPVTER